MLRGRIEAVRLGRVFGTTHIVVMSLLSALFLFFPVLSSGEELMMYKDSMFMKWVA